MRGAKSTLQYGKGMKPTGETRLNVETGGAISGMRFGVEGQGRLVQIG